MPPRIPRDLPNEQSPLIDPFLADVMTKMLGDTADIGKMVDDNYRAEIAELRATIGLIRDGVEACFDKPYMPQPRVVMKQLYPSRERIKEEVAAREQHTS